MNLLDPVSKIMTKDPITVHTEDNLKKVDTIFSNNKIHHIPVVENGKLKGIVSKSDFLFFRRGFKYTGFDAKLEDIRLKNYRVKEIMTTKLAKLDPTDKVNVALEIFKENIFHAIPIVDDERLIGIVTTYDIIRQLASNQTVHTNYVK